MEWRRPITSYQQENGWSLTRPPINAWTGGFLKRLDWRISERVHPDASCRLDVENRYDVMVAVDNDDLIIDDEVEKSTPLRMDFDQHRSDLDHTHRRGHDGANPDLEVHIIDPWCITAHQHG